MSERHAILYRDSPRKPWALMTLSLGSLDHVWWSALDTQRQERLLGNSHFEVNVVGEDEVGKPTRKRRCKLVNG